MYAHLNVNDVRPWITQVGITSAVPSIIFRTYRVYTGVEDAEMVAKPH